MASVATPPPNLNHFDDHSQSSPPAATEIHERVRIPGFPVAPSHVHSLSNRYPSFPLDPTHPLKPNVHQMNNNGGDQAMHPSMVHFPQSGPMMPDRRESEPQFGSGIPSRTDAIAPLIPPRPGLMTGPSGPFMPPNRLALPQGPHFNRIPQQPQGRPWKGPAPYPYRPAGSQHVLSQTNPVPMGPPPFMIPNASPIENSVGTYMQSTQPSPTIAQKTKPQVVAQTMPVTIVVPSTTASPVLKPSQSELDKTLLESIMNAVKWSDSTSSSSVCE